MLKWPVRAGLFDLGNTLFYDDPAAWPSTYLRAEDALWASLRAAGVRAAPDSLYGHASTFLQYYYELREGSLLEPGAVRVLMELLAGQTPPVEQSISRAALDAMYRVTQLNWQLEDDAVSTLQRLLGQGLRLAAISNSSDDLNSQRMVARAGLQPRFEFVLTSAGFGIRKPGEQIFLEALSRLDVPAAQAVMVGDNYEADILGAHAVGMQTIWVTRHIRERPPAMPILPDETVSALAEIPTVMP